MGIEIKEIGPRCELGEGPHWEAQKGALLYADITKGELHRLYVKSGRHQVLRVAPGQSGKTVAFAIPVQDQPDLYVIGHGRSFALVDWPESDPDLTTREVKVTLHTVEAEGHKSGNRINDGKCDPSGRLWAGTMGAFSDAGVPPELGALYRVDPDLTLTTTLEKVTLSNGLAWDTARNILYYIDSLLFRVDAFDYDDKTGAIANRRTVLDYKKAGLTERELPDGMCLDSAGDLWVACLRGSKVIRINPATRKITQTIELPATNITSVCFGGDNLNTLFVTSASIGFTEAALRTQPAGATFAVTGLGVTGLPPTGFKVDQGALKGRV